MHKYIYFRLYHCDITQSNHYKTLWNDSVKRVLITRAFSFTCILVHARHYVHILVLVNM